MKKKLFFTSSIFLVLLLVLLFFQKPIISRLVYYELSSSLEKLFDSKVRVQNYQLLDNKIIIEDLEIGDVDQDGFNFELDRLDINYAIDWFKWNISLDIDVFQPKLSLLKGSENLFALNLDFKPNGFGIKYDITISEGLIELINLEKEDQPQSIGFSIKGVGRSNTHTIEGFFKSESRDTGVFEFTLKKDMKSIDFQSNMENLLVSEVTNALSYWVNPVNTFLKSWNFTSGYLDGSFALSLSENKEPLTQSEINLKNIVLENEQYPLFLSIPDAHLSLWEPVRLSTTERKLNLISQTLSEVIEKNTGHLSIQKGAKLHYHSLDRKWDVKGFSGEVHFKANQPSELLLEGEYLYDEQLAHISLNGKGRFLGQGSVPSGDLKLRIKKEDEVETRIRIFSDQLTQNRKNIRLFLSNVAESEAMLLYEIISKDLPLLKGLNIERTQMNASLRMVFDKKKLTEVMLDKFAISNTSFTLKKLQSKGEFSEISGETSLDFSHKKPLETLEAFILVSNGSFFLPIEGRPPLEFTDVQTQLAIRKGVVDQSLIQAKTLGFSSTLKWDRFSEEAIFKFATNGKINEITDYVPENIKQGIQSECFNDTLYIKCQANKIEQGLKFSGQVNLLDNEEIEQDAYFGFDFDVKKFFNSLNTHTLSSSENEITRILMENFSPFQTVLGSKLLSRICEKEREIKIKNGWFLANKVDLEKFVVPFFFSESGLQIEGIVDIHGKFDQENIIIQYDGKEILLNTPGVEIAIKSLNQCSQSSYPGYFNIDLKSHSYFGGFDLREASLRLKNSGLIFEKIEGPFYISKTQGFFPRIFAESEGMKIYSRLIVDWFPSKGLELDAWIEEVDAKVYQVKSFASKLGLDVLDNFPIDGDVKVKSGGGYIHLLKNKEERDIDIKFIGQLENGSYQRSKPYIDIQQFRCGFNYNHKASELSLFDINSQLNLRKGSDEKSYNLSIDPLSLSLKGDLSTSFDIKLKEKTKDFASLKGHLFKDSERDQLEINLEPNKTHIGEILFNHASFNFLKGKLVNCDVKFESDVHSFINDLFNFYQLGFIESDRDINKWKKLSELKGTVEGVISYTQKIKGLEWKILGQKLLFQELNLPDFITKGQFKKDLKVLELKFGEFSSHTNLVYDDFKLFFNNVDMSLKGIYEAKINGYVDFNDLKFHGEVDSKIENLEDLKTLPFLSHLKELGLEGDLKLRGNFSGSLFDDKELGGDLSIDSVDLKFKNFKFKDLNKEKVTVKFEKDKFTINDLNLHIIAYDNNPIDIDLKSQDIQFDTSSNLLQIPNAKFSLDPSTFFRCLDLTAKNIPPIDENGYLKGLTIKDKLHGELALTYSQRSSIFKVLFNEPNLYFLDKKLCVDKITFEKDDLKWGIVSSLSYNNFPYWLIVKKDSPIQNTGRIIISDLDPLDSQLNKTSPLVVQWNINEQGGFVVQRVGGTLAGVQLNMARQKDAPNDQNLLFGKAKINGKELKNRLPSKISGVLNRFSIGDGYELSGKLSIPQKDLLNFNFEGQFGGKNFEILDYSLKTLSAKLTVNRGKVHLQRLKISDPAGNVFINRVTFEKKGSNNWSFSIPWIDCQNLCPSLLHKVGESTVKAKPLIVDNIIVKGLKGDLNNENSIKGYGRIEFHKSHKKTSSILEIPAHIISRLGLDLNMLVPVEGSILYEIKDSKIYLTKFIDVFGSEKHCRFLLAKQPYQSYIDFNGNLNLKLKMKQYVLLKFTQPFVISIGGNLKKPTYKFQKKASSFILNTP